MVLQNPKQMMVFDTFYPIENLKIYIPIFAALAVYARFSAYHKVNNDLFIAKLVIFIPLFYMLLRRIFKIRKSLTAG